MVKLLKAGGKVHVAPPASLPDGSGDDAAEAFAARKRALTFAGFLKVAPCPEDDRVLSGERAAWDTGASAPVRLSFKKPSATAAAVTNGNGSTPAAKNGSQNGNGSAAASKTWKLALDDDEDGEGGGVGSVFGGPGVGDEGDDDDLVDEDALLEGSAPVKRASETVSASHVTCHKQAFTVALATANCVGLCDGSYLCSQCRAHDRWWIPK